MYSPSSLRIKIALKEKQPMFKFKSEYFQIPFAIAKPYLKCGTSSKFGKVN